MAETERLICDASALEDAGIGVRFEVVRFGQTQPAFVIRYAGRVYGYINACAHVPVELDWMEGDFFDADQRYLICATHGARYEPTTGHCVMGPCTGARLRPLDMLERDEKIYLVEHGDP